MPGATPLVQQEPDGSGLKPTPDLVHDRSVGTPRWERFLRRRGGDATVTATSAASKDARLGWRGLVRGPGSHGDGSSARETLCRSAIAAGSRDDHRNTSIPTTAAALQRSSIWARPPGMSPIGSGLQGGGNTVDRNRRTSKVGATTRPPRDLRRQTTPAIAALSVASPMNIARSVFVSSAPSVP